MTAAWKPQFEWTASDAVLRDVPVWLGIAGPSSSGKTFSALLVGEGMREIKGGELGLIDTENRRATHYAKTFKFKHLPFAAPFTAERYLDAVRYMVLTMGCRVVIVDSMSHEHEGEGGHLLRHKTILDEMVKKRLSHPGERRKEWQLRDALNFTAWIEPAAARTHMVNNLLQIDVSLIFCFRAKEKLDIKKGRDGGVRSLGYMPIAGDELVYNSVAVAILPPRAMGVPDWEAKGCKINGGMERFFPPGKPLDRDTGRWLQQWATGAEVEVKWTPPPSSEQPPRREGGVRRGPPIEDRGDPFGDMNLPPQGGPPGPEPPPADATSAAPAAPQQPELPAAARSTGAAGATAPATGAGQGSLLGEAPVDRTRLPDEFPNAKAFVSFARSFLAGADPIEAAAWDAKYGARLARLKDTKLHDDWAELADLLRLAKTPPARQASGDVADPAAAPL